MKFKNIRKSKGQIILEKVARLHGVSVGIIRTEMQKAIDQGLTNPDPKIQAAWQSICRNGNPPSPEELVEILTKNIKDRLD